MSKLKIAILSFFIIALPFIYFDGTLDPVHTLRFLTFSFVVLILNLLGLKNIMHHGDLSSKIDLMELENLENLYALGAVEQLKGEILIMNSKPYISSCEHKNESHVVNKDLRKNLKVDNLSLIHI